MRLGMGLGLGNLLSGASGLAGYVLDNLKLYLDFTSTKSDTLKFPSEGSTEFGNSKYIEFGEISLTDFSISAWVYMDDLSAQTILGDGNNNNWVRVDGAQSIKLKAGGTSTTFNPGGLTFTTGEWQHICIIRKDNKVKAYRNAIAGTLSPTNAGTFVPDRIGAKIGNTSYFHGKMANVAVWSRALEPEEIQSIMNKSYSQLKGVEKTSLVSWWALDDIFLGETTNVSDNVTSGYTTAKIIENKASSISDNLIPDGEFETGISNFSPANNGVLSYNSDKNLVITGNGGTGSATISSVTLEVSTEYIFEIALAGGTDNDTILIRLDKSALGGISYGNIYSVASQGTNSSPKKVSLKFKSDSSATGFFLKITNINDTKTAIISSVKLFKASGYGASIGATTTTSVYGGNAPILPRAVDVAKEGQADAIGDGSASFNGDADHIELGSITSSNALSLSGSAGSISAWIYLPDVSDGDDFKRIIDKSDGASASKGYSIVVRTDGTINTYIAGSGIITSDAGEITDAEWFHIVWKWDGTNHKLYKNGIEIKSASSSSTPPSDTANMSIGSWNHSTGREFKGNISQIGLWRGALTQAQIQSVMESTSYSKIPADVKSTLGAERVLNSDFSDGENLWTLNNANVVNEVLEIDEGAFSYYAQQSVDGGGSAYRQFESGYLMKLEIVVDEYTSGGTIIYATGNNIGTFNSAGTHTIYYKPSSNEYLRLRSDGGGFEGKISSVSIKRVTNDIVAYYPLDGSSEVKGLSFTTDDYIQLPVPFSYTNHSISVWAKHGTTGSAIFDARDSSSDGVRIGIDSSGRLQYKVNGSNALVATAYTNQWVHYFCTYDGSTMRVYVNGVQAKTNGTSQTIDTTTNARIGRNSYSTGYFDGSISSLALYSVTKSADEALAIYNDGIGGDESSNSNLVGYYKLDNASTVSDLSSNTNNGTVYGATLISAGTTDSVGNNDGGLL